MSLRAYLRGIGIGMVVTALILTISSGKKTAISDSEIRSWARELGMVQGNELLIGTEVSKNSASSNSAADKDSIEIEVDEEDKKGDGGAANAAKGDKKADSTANAAKGDKKVDSVSAAGTSMASASQSTGASANAKPKVTFSTEKSPAVESVSEAVNAASSASKPRSTSGTDTEGTAAPTSAASSETTASSAETPTPSSETPASSVETSAPSDETFSTSSETSTSSGETFVLHISRGESSYAAAKALEEAGIVDSAVAFDKYLVSQGIDRQIDAGDHIIPKKGTYEEIGQALLR